jgi:IPT/TIG domain
MTLAKRRLGRRLAGAGVAAASLMLGLEAPVFATSPIISSFSPTSGPAGCVMVITGTNFKDPIVTSVDIDAVVFSFNDLQPAVRTPRLRTLLVEPWVNAEYPANIPHWIEHRRVQKWRARRGWMHSPTATGCHCRPGSQGIFPFSLDPLAVVGHRQGAPVSSSS